MSSHLKYFKDDQMLTLLIPRDPRRSNPEKVILDNFNISLFLGSITGSIPENVFLVSVI